QRLRLVDAAERAVPAQLLDLVRAGRAKPERARGLHRPLEDPLGDRLSASGWLLPGRAQADRRSARALGGDEAADSRGRRESVLQARMITWGAPNRSPSTASARGVPGNP